MTTTGTKTNAWTFRYSPIYEIDAGISQVFYMGNSLITLGTTYIMTRIFTTTVLDRYEKRK